MSGKLVGTGQVSAWCTEMKVRTLRLHFNQWYSSECFIAKFCTRGIMSLSKQKKQTIRKRKEKQETGPNYRYGGFELPMYNHYVEYLRTGTYPDFTLPEFGNDETDKKKMKSKQSAFRRRLKDFPLAQDGVTLMYLKTHFRELKKAQQQRAPMVKMEESSDESDSDSEKHSTAEPPMLPPETESPRKVVLKAR